MFIMFNMHACVCTHVCACVCGCVHAHVCGRCPHPPGGIPAQISKNAIRLGTNQDISIPFKDLESVSGVSFWWMDGWVSGSKHVKS